MTKKEATIFYKLPIEQMRGKLAAKQEGILYAGQSQGENTMSLPMGKHLSTNFEKYIVLSVRRGVNKFYVKSRTAIRNTIGTIYAKITMLLSMILVERLYQVYKNGGGVTFVGFNASYEYWGNGMTVREYISSCVLQAVRNRRQYVQYKGIPNDNGIYPMNNLCTNPFTSWNSQGVMIEGIEFPTYPKEKGVIQNNLHYYAAALNGVSHKFTVVNTVTGTKYERYAVSDADSSFADLAATIQYLVYELDANDQGKLSTITIRNEAGIVLLQGKPFKDQSLTTEIEVTEKIADISTVYVQG